jgi:hypothetical protein
MLYWSSHTPNRQPRTSISDSANSAAGASLAAPPMPISFRKFRLFIVMVPPDCKGYRGTRISLPLFRSRPGPHIRLAMSFALGHAETSASSRAPSRQNLWDSFHFLFRAHSGWNRRPPLLSHGWCRRRLPASECTCIIAKIMEG